MIRDHDLNMKEHINRQNRDLKIRKIIRVILRSLNAYHIVLMSLITVLMGSYGVITSFNSLMSSNSNVLKILARRGEG